MNSGGLLPEAAKEILSGITTPTSKKKNEQRQTLSLHIKYNITECHKSSTLRGFHEKWEISAGLCTALFLFI